MYTLIINLVFGVFQSTVMNLVFYLLFMLQCSSWQFSIHTLSSMWCFPIYIPVQLSNYTSVFNTFKYHVFAPMGRFQLESIYLYFPPSSQLFICFLSCRPFVAITTLSTGFVGVEVTSVSWLEQLTVGV